MKAVDTKASDPGFNGRDIVGMSGGFSGFCFVAGQ